MVCLFVVFHRKDIKSLLLCVRWVACFRLLIVEPGDIRRMARCAYFQKCLFANAWPDPVFKYCSNSAAA